MEGSDFWWIRSLLIVSLGVNTEDVSLLALDKCPSPSPSLILGWPPLPHSSASALTMTVTFLHTLHHYHYPARVGESWHKHEANFLTQILLHTLLAEWAAISAICIRYEKLAWKYSPMNWFLWLPVWFFSTVPAGDIDKRPSNTCLTSSFWCQP